MPFRNNRRKLPRRAGILGLAYGGRIPYPNEKLALATRSVFGRSGSTERLGRALR